VTRPIVRGAVGLWWAAGFGVFALLAIANSAGYRFGVSDQAFYLPAIARALDPSLFPRDAPLLDAQARLTAADELVGGAVRLGAPIGLDTPGVMFGAYLASLMLLFAGAMAIGRTIFRTSWGPAALAAALTLRHGISRAGVNTLEGYFHPRLAVFAIGALALAAFLRGRTLVALALVAAAGVLHPTTALWFAIWIAVAGLVADAGSRKLLIASGAAAMAAAAWALTAGPLAPRLARMDDVWLAVIAGKDYLFPLGWPAYAWAANLAYPVVIIALARVRARRGLLAPRERGLVAGALALVAIFFLLLPFNAARVALAVQLQIARIFWMADLLATVMLVWWLVEGATARGQSRRAAVAAVSLAVASLARGAYLMEVQFADRPLVRIGLPRAGASRPNDTQAEWHDAMAWAARTPPSSHWLVDPGHTYRYGTSVRVAALRDVFLEEVKDAAIAMYSREVAMRLAERTRALGDFGSLDAARARALAAQYDLDYLVAEHALDLPVAHRNARFVIYRLR
jgi:hypothetical protein